LLSGLFGALFGGVFGWPGGLFGAPFDGVFGMLFGRLRRPGGGVFELVFVERSVPCSTGVRLAVRRGVRRRTTRSVVRAIEGRRAGFSQINAEKAGGMERSAKTGVGRRRLPPLSRGGLNGSEGVW
jgi:hypothetical protein